MKTTRGLPEACGMLLKVKKKSVRQRKKFEVPGEKRTPDLLYRTQKVMGSIPVGHSECYICPTLVACVAGVNGEGEGEQERGRRGTGARDEGTPATKTNKGDFCLIG